MARNFSEDGAVGAMTGNAPAAGTQTGGVSTTLTPDNFNLTGTPAGASSTMPTAMPDSSGGYGGGGLASDQGNPGVIGGIPTSDMYGGGGWGGGGFAPMGGGAASGAQPSGSSYPAPAWNFSQGGAIDDSEGGDPNATDPQGSMMGNQLQQSINQALMTVNNTLSYGRKLHGIGGQQQAMNTDGFRQSDNIDDRRDTPGDPAQAGDGSARPTYKRNPTEQLVDRARSAYAGATNKMSQDAGINDIGGDGSTATPGAQQAIPTDEEEAQ